MEENEEFGLCVCVCVWRFSFCFFIYPDPFLKADWIVQRCLNSPITWQCGMTNNFRSIHPSSCSVCRGWNVLPCKTWEKTFIKRLRPPLCTNARMRAAKREEWNDQMIFKHHFAHESRCWRCKWHQPKQGIKIPLCEGAVLLAKITRDEESCHA